VTDTVVDAHALGERLADGSLTSGRLVEQTLDRIAAMDGALRSFITVVADSAHADARESDRRRSRGAALGPLDGIPFAVKDNMAVAGVTRTNGGRLVEGEVSGVDAGVVSRLRTAGAVLVGTLNMHEGALGATTDNPFWGRCQNPLAQGFTPGGSSGGSAAAVGAGLVPFALGTDTIGSVRIPAAYCGLWGLKPTTGLVDTSGVACLTWSLDTIGPITRSLRDLRLVTAIIADRSPDAPVPAVSALRFAVPHPSLLEGCEPEVADLFNALVSRLERGGATVRQAGFPQLEFGKLRRAALLIAEVEGACLLEAELSKPDRYSDGFRAMLDYGRNASAARVALAYREIRQARLSFSASLAQVDALLLPTTPQRAFPHDDPVPANQADFTVLASAADAPAIAMPLPADTGLPASAQLIGSPCAEGRLLAIAETLLQDGVVARTGR
jgi:aspartyl-tRNA(Asn)/glutamyl-tRNA(Gln) amidotransferase subunit A